MAGKTDEELIATTAHDLWEAEGRPHGRDREHWDSAKEIVALKSSGGVPKKPRLSGAKPPVEEKSIAIDNEGEFPNLTDTGEHDLTAVDREPAVTKTKVTEAVTAKPAAKTAPKPPEKPANSSKPAAAEPKGKSKAK